MNFLAFLPASAQKAAKAYLASIGAVLVALSVSLPDVPEWVTVAIGILTALGVYVQPNAVPEE